MISCMVDLETFSSRHDAVVVSIGAVLFDISIGVVNEHSFRLHVAPDPLEQGRRHIDPSTVRWWMGQHDEARSALLDLRPTPVADCLNRFVEFYGEAKELWAHSTFDPVIFRSLFDDFGVRAPWHYRDVRDIRTIMSLAGRLGMDTGRDKTKNAGVAHDALSDCENQVRYVSEAWRFIADKSGVFPG